MKLLNRRRFSHITGHYLHRRPFVKRLFNKSQINLNIATTGWTAAVCGLTGESFLVSRKFSFRLLWFDFRRFVIRPAFWHNKWVYLDIKLTSIYFRKSLLFWKTFQVGYAAHLLRTVNSPISSCQRWQLDFEKFEFFAWRRF